MTNFEGKMNMNGFQKFCKTRQVLLSPVINTQQALMAATLGTAGWELVASRTLEVYPGRNITIRELLALVRRHIFCEFLFLNLPQFNSNYIMPSIMIERCLKNF